MRGCWGAMTEVGAAWIAGSEQSIFNVKPFKPEKPLDSDSPWVDCRRNDVGFELSLADLDNFSSRIETIAKRMKYDGRSRSENVQKLQDLLAQLNN